MKCRYVGGKYMHFMTASSRLLKADKTRCATLSTSLSLIGFFIIVAGETN
jgi:hypothetical protein